MCGSRRVCCTQVPLHSGTWYSGTGGHGLPDLPLRHELRRKQPQSRRLRERATGRRPTRCGLLGKSLLEEERTASWCGGFDSLRQLFGQRLLVDSLSLAVGKAVVRRRILEASVLIQRRGTACVWCLTYVYVCILSCGTTDGQESLGRCRFPRRGLTPLALV